MQLNLDSCVFVNVQMDYTKPDDSFTSVSVRFPVDRLLSHVFQCSTTCYPCPRLQVLALTNLLLLLLPLRNIHYACNSDGEAMWPLHPIITRVTQRWAQNRRVMCLFTPNGGWCQDTRRAHIGKLLSHRNACFLCSGALPALWISVMQKLFKGFWRRQIEETKTTEDSQDAAGEPCCVLKQVTQKRKNIAITILGEQTLASVFKVTIGNTWYLACRLGNCITVVVLYV